MGTYEAISVQSYITGSNEIAQNLFARYAETTERFEEARRLFSLFSDAGADSVRMLQLQETMLQITKFFLEFSQCHLDAVVKMKQVEATLNAKRYSDSARDSALRQLEGLTDQYREYAASMGRIMQEFDKASAYFLFPAEQED